MSLGYGAVSRRDDGNLDLFIPVEEDGYFSIPTVAHEAFHTADFIADKVGLEYTHGTCNERKAEPFIKPPPSKVVVQSSSFWQSCWRGSNSTCKLLVDVWQNLLTVCGV